MTMARFVVLLRAINVGGRNLVSMAELRRLIELAGGSEVASLLQSGNAVFTAPAGAGAAVVRRLEAALAGELGVQPDCLVRSAAEWSKLVAENPFGTEAKRDPGHLLLVALTAAPGAPALAALRAAIRGPERIAAAGAQLYAVYPDGIGNSKLTLPLIERTLDVRGTGRNWNTVLKVATLLQG